MKIGFQTKQKTTLFNYIYLIEVSYILFQSKKKQCIGFIFLLGEKLNDVITKKYTRL